MNIISDTKRLPGSYNEIDESGANTGLPAYRQPIEIIAPGISTPAEWIADTAYSLGATVRPTTNNDDGHYYICIVAGTSHATTEPTWPGAGHSVTDDNTLVWGELCDASGIIGVHTPTRIYSAADAAMKSGAGSIAHRMAKAAFDQFSAAEVYLNLVNDTGTPATSTITITGTAIGAGVMQIEVGNGTDSSDRVLVMLDDGDTAAGIAAHARVVIATLHALPATASVAAGVLTLRAKNAGTPGEEIGKYNSVSADYRVVVTILNTTGITATVTGWAGGTTNPDISDALDASVAGGYALKAIPYRDDTNIDALDDHLTLVSDQDNCNGARGFVAITSTIAGATTVAAQNSKRMHIAFKRGCKYTSFEMAAAFAAMHAETGHAALPLNTMRMKKCDASDTADILERNEMEALLWAGVTPFNDDPTGVVRCKRSITMYTTNVHGSPDPLYLDTTTIANMDYSRKAVRAADESSFAQSVLRENHVDGEPAFVVTPEDVNSLHFLVFKDLEKNGNVQQVDFHKDKFTAVRSATVEGRVESSIPIEVVQGLHILANYFRVVSSVGQ